MGKSGDGLMLNYDFDNILMYLKDELYNYNPFYSLTSNMHKNNYELCLLTDKVLNVRKINRLQKIFGYYKFYLILITYENEKIKLIFKNGGKK